MTLPNSFIKNLVLEINPNFRFKNSPIQIGDEKETDIFIGRRLHLDKFLSFFTDSKKGVFLVTGFRGMGKTSFVNHVINKYRQLRGKNKKNKDVVIPITITLAQNEPKEIDILRLMTTSVFNKYIKFIEEHRKEGNERNKYYERQNKKQQRKWRFFSIFSLILVVIPVLVFLKNDSIREFITVSNRGIPISPSIAFDWIKITCIVLLSIFIIAFLVSLARYQYLKSEEHNKRDETGNAFICIKWLVERCHSTISEVHQSFSEIEIQNFRTQIFSDNDKRNKEYPIATSKEIESELGRFLELAFDEHRIEFIFIFDELDKVDPAISTSYLYDDMESFEKQRPEGVYHRDLRDRKQAIINIIAGQKNFLTTAKARFIFIAGHEMFDASLADIADRESSISSIFTYIFNIESLLKENEIEISCNMQTATFPAQITNFSSLSFAIEEFLKKTLFSENGDTNEEELYEIVLKRYSKKKKRLTDQELAKIYITLQNFVIYLTYRSNGSPKKLIREIQEFIRRFDTKKIEQFETKGILAKWNEDEEKTEMNRNYLFFNFYEQYRIELINYLYRPFIISNGRNFKHYSDNIIVSTPYLFDHLLKFHPFAFSYTNLELIPEVLSTNKTPSLNEHIKQIINYLSNNHIRETEIGIFDYKYYSRTLNELSFLSKKFEKEAAAFNFTLDESYLVKLHIRSKIKELRSIYSKFMGDKLETDRVIFSIAHLNGMLGDLHFFDQEFDDSIVAYSDAINPIGNSDVCKMSIRDFITLVRNKLKLGLCYEKINSFEDALAFYSDCSQDSKKFILHRLRVSQPVKNDFFEGSDARNKYLSESPEYYESSSINDLLQIINQSFLAKIIIQEKLGVEGISTPKISIALGGFLNIVEVVSTQCGKNHIICSNAYLLTGKVLYFKNSSAVTHADPKYLENYPKKTAEQLISLRKYLDTRFLNKESHLHKRKPILALCFYIMGLQEIMDSRTVSLNKISFANILNTTNLTSGKNIIGLFLQPLNTFLYSGNESFTGIHYRYIAIFLSNIGDCLLSSINTRNENGSYKRYTLGEFFSEDKIKEALSGPLKTIDMYNCFIHSSDKMNTICDVLKCYYLSGKYFQHYGRLASCSFQFRKILHILRLVLKEDTGNDSSELFGTFIKRNLVEPIIEIANTNVGHCNRHIKNKATRIFKDICTPDISYLKNNLFKHPEIVEANLLNNFIRLKLGLDLDVKEEKIITPENTHPTQFARIFELHFHANYLNKKYLESFLNPVLKFPKKVPNFLERPPFQHCSVFVQPRTNLDNYENKISDYLFSMFSVLRILKIYGTDYLMGYSFIAFTYYKLGILIKYINKHDPDGILKDKIKKTLELVFNERLFGSFDHDFQFNMAKENFQKAIRLHTSGNEYKKAVSEMVYLEDDFNDNAYHFGAAYDRYLMINGIFANKIKECEARMAENPVQIG